MKLEADVILLPVLVDAPSVRALVRAYLATKSRFRVYALVLAMPPEGPLHRVVFAAVRAHVGPFARFALSLLA